MDAKSLASSAVVNAFSGSAGGVLAFSLTYPLTTISTRLQVQQQNAASKSAADADFYAGPLDALQKIVLHEGPQGLFSGLRAGLFAQALSQGVYYYWYSLVKTYFERRLLPPDAKGVLPTWANLVVAAIAGTLTTTLTTPAWVINTRGQMPAKSGGKGGKRSATVLLKEIVAEDGVLGLWRGLVPSLILVINPVIQYAAFETLKGRVLPAGQRPSGIQIFALGAIAKALATVVTFPYIMAKTRLQVKPGSEERARYTGTLDVLQKVVRHEGPLALYKGMGSKLIQSVLTASFLFLFQDRIVMYTIRLVLLLQRRRLAAAAKA